jgi:flagella basal body P-ring formation protein FlgA
LNKLLLAALTSINLFAFSENTAYELREAIKAEYAKEYQTITFVDIKIVETSKEDSNTLILKGLDIQKQNLQRNSGIVLAIFEDEKRIQKKTFIRYEIEALVEVTKAKYNLPKDKIIVIDDVAFENIQFKHFYSKPVTKQEISALLTKRFIPSGTLLTQKDVGKAPLIKKGTTVSATMTQDALEIELEAVAMEDGNANETINIRTKNGKIMRALVDKDGKVVIK